MRSLERFISDTLRVGVLVSSVVIGIGLLMFFITGQSGYPADSIPVGLTDVLSGVAALKSFAVIDLGLMLLILTPVFRVVVSIYSSIAEKDKAYIFINSYVLLVLIISLILGKAEG